MKRAFLFDYGGVMTAGGAGNELAVRFGENLGISPDDAFALLQPAWNGYFNGSISETDFWKSAETEYGHLIDESKRNIWNGWQDMSTIPEMEELVKKLKASDHIVGLLSNVSPNTLTEIKDHGGYDLFDFLILSCEVGYNKPDPQIYESAMLQLRGYSPSDVVFLDDIQRFLDPAAALGMTTILVTSPSQATSEVEALLQTNIN